MRRQVDHCVCTIGGKPYPVLDWSMGGCQLLADSRMFSYGEKIEFTLRFKVRSTILNITHNARVVRRSRDRIGLQYAPLDSQTRRSFQTVMDHLIVNEFVQSQLNI